MDDKLSEKILELINRAREPMETKELEEALKSESRSKILYRLTDLRGQGKVKGKHLGAGKGTWVWWSVEAFK